MPPIDAMAAHTALTKLLDRVPRDGRAAAAIREARRLAARLALATMDTLDQLDRDPAEAVGRAATLAVEAGASWQDVAASVNRASQRRGA